MKFTWELEYENEDDIPQGLRDEGVYAEADDGKWKMVDALARKTNDLGKLTGLRDKLRKDLKEANAKVADYEAALDGREVDDLAAALDELEGLRQQKEDFEKGGDTEVAEVRAELREAKTALNKATRDLAAKTKTLEETEEAFGGVKGELGSLKFESIFGKEAKELGIKNSTNLLMAGAKQEFKYEDGDIVPLKEDGPDFRDWLSAQVSENQFLTADLSSAGMDTKNSGGVSGGKRTYKRSDFDQAAPADREAIMTKVRTGEASLVD